MTRPTKTAAFEAAKAWNAAALQALLQASPDLAQAVDARGRTALHIACAVRPGGAMLGEPHGIATVSALLGAGADLEAVAPTGEDEGDFRATPLWFAVARGENPTLRRHLLKLGADASTSLWAAVWRDDEKLCGELLKSKLRLNLRAHGETPLFYAARLKRLKALQLLLDAGADPTIADDRGRDALAIAQARRLPKSLIDRLADAKRGAET